MTARGLERANSLKDIGNDGNAGRLDLGLAASTRSGARAYADYSHKLVNKEKWRMSAFSTAFASVGKRGTDAGVSAGLRFEW